MKSEVAEKERMTGKEIKDGKKEGKLERKKKKNEGKEKETKERKSVIKVKIKVDSSKKRRLQIGF